MPALSYSTALAIAMAASPISARSFGVRYQGWGNLDQLLMPALNRAIALAQMDDVAMPVGQDLEFDMMRPLDILFEKDASVAERAWASRDATSMFSRSSASDRTTRSPRPPPPALALMMTG